VIILAIVIFAAFSFFPNSAHSETFECVAKYGFAGPKGDLLRMISKFKIVTAEEKESKKWLGTHPLDFKFKGPFEPINLKTGVKIGKIAVSHSIGKQSDTPSNHKFFQIHGFQRNDALIGFFFNQTYMTLIRIDKWMEEKPIYIYDSYAPHEKLIKGNCK